MYSKVSMTWNSLNRLDRKYLAPGFRVETEIREI